MNILIFPGGAKLKIIVFLKLTEKDYGTFRGKSCFMETVL